MDKRGSIRWLQRLENFDRAVTLLREGMERHRRGELDDLAKEGLIQRFEVAFELAWKTLRDYLEHEGVELTQITPRAVIKAAFAARVIRDGEAWMEMLEQRNLLSHTYDRVNFEAALARIDEIHLESLCELQRFFRQKRGENTP